MAKNYKVIAINRDGEEIQKWFDTLAEAQEYAITCHEHGCWAIRVRDFTK